MFKPLPAYKRVYACIFLDGGYVATMPMYIAGLVAPCLITPPSPLNDVCQCQGVYKAYAMREYTHTYIYYLPIGNIEENKHEPKQKNTTSKRYACIIAGYAPSKP